MIEEHIHLVPLGDVDGQVVRTLKEALPASLPMTSGVDIYPREKLFQPAYNSGRGQYDAETLLNEMARRINLDKRVERILAVADVDLYAPELNFVFGVADPNTGITVISVARLRNEFYGLKPDAGIFRKRVLKEAIHELGHSWGIKHCPDKKCVMYFSNTLEDTDRKSYKFCHECGNKLNNRYESPLIKIQF